jgi:hypothetical protein
VFSRRMPSCNASWPRVVRSGWRRRCARSMRSTR